jgi:hypothetical protein
MARRQYLALVLIGLLLVVLSCPVQRVPPSMAVYNLLELWPLGFSLLLAVSLLLIVRRHVHR